MSLSGHLLVATPLIADPNFERTVVLLLAHGPHGAFGVVLNRPGELPVSAVAPDWSDVAAAPGTVFVGGPVGTDSVLGLGRSPTLAEGDDEVIVGDCAAVDLRHPPGPDGPSWTAARLFAGSAGWAPGQLEDELREGSWWTLDARAEDVVTSDPDGLWARVLRRQGGEVAWFANHPDDPSAN
ncbi:MAG: YqgE/AlgH family protein [Acidimicrobiales bacterium]